MIATTTSPPRTLCKQWFASGPNGFDYQTKEPREPCFGIAQYHSPGVNASILTPSEERPSAVIGQTTAGGGAASPNLPFGPKRSISGSRMAARLANPA